MASKSRATKQAAKSTRMSKGKPRRPPSGRRPAPRGRAPLSPFEAEAAAINAQEFASAIEARAVQAEVMSYMSDAHSGLNLEVPKINQGTRARQFLERRHNGQQA